MSDTEWQGVNAATAATRPTPPVSTDQGLVVRPLMDGQIVEVVPEPSTQTDFHVVAAALAPAMLLPANPARLNFTISNTSFADTLYILCANAGVVSPTVYTVAIRPRGYYEDPSHYVGEVTGVWDPAATGSAGITEYLP